MITISRPSIFSATLLASDLALRLLASSSAFMPSNLARLSAVARSALPRFKQKIAGKSVLDADDFAHLAKLGDALQKNDFHIRSP